MEVQLKLVVENGTISAAINAQGKNLLFSPFLASFFIYLVGDVTKCLTEP